MPGARSQDRKRGRGSRRCVRGIANELIDNRPCSLVLVTIRDARCERASDTQNKPHTAEPNIQCIPPDPRRRQRAVTPLSSFPRDVIRETNRAGKQPVRQRNRVAREFGARADTPVACDLTVGLSAGQHCAAQGGIESTKPRAKSVDRVVSPVQWQCTLERRSVERRGRIHNSAQTQFANANPNADERSEVRPREARRDKNIARECGRRSTATHGLSRGNDSQEHEVASARTARGAGRSVGPTASSAEQASRACTHHWDWEHGDDDTGASTKRPESKRARESTRTEAL